MIKFYEYKPISGCAIEKINENRAYNRGLLAKGVIGDDCTDVRQAENKDYVKYGEYLPANAHFSCVEEYANGALNIFVRNDANNCIGFVSVRP